jgi:hypothetical protein
MLPLEAPEVDWWQTAVDDIGSLRDSGSTVHRKTGWIYWNLGGGGQMRAE